MKFDNNFSEKLVKCLEKHAKRDEPLESYEIEEGNQYYFYYKIMEEDASKTCIISFYDDTITKYMQKTCHDSGLYEIVPFIDIENLLFSINNIRVGYHTKYNNEYFKKVLDFVEELFENKISKMTNMIKNKYIDYESLWYHYDKKNAIYVVKKFEEDICFKYKNFQYFELTDNVEYFRVIGEIIFPIDKKYNIALFEYEIKKFKGTKKIDTIDLKELSESNRQKYLDESKKIIEYANGIHHVHLKGKQYIKKRNSVIYTQRNCQVIVDNLGIDKYYDRPYEMTFIKSIDVENMTENEYVTMFPFISIYNLGVSKMWGMAHVKNIYPLEYKSDAFDYLVLDQNKKEMIKNLISNYSSDTNKDFIEGKGYGLIFLLYGSPGVGKTLTAEATCEYLKRPLFNLSIGDLGTNPEEMEAILERVSEYANRWKAILMIDEVDVFLEERSNGDIVRNAMVGIFLKFLEYNEGIIFLITNRLQCIDPAVKSRIHIFLQYKNMDNINRKKIWISLLDKYEIKIDNQTLEKLSELNLNGREIRNNLKMVSIIHKQKNTQITSKSLLEYLEDFVKIINEFNEKVPCHIYS